MASYFQYFKTPIDTIELPEKFTFPFYYEPHPLCIKAAHEVQDYLQNQKDFKHNFGLDNNQTTPAIGKMFGVLIVQNNNSEIGYITAVSGKLAGTNTHKLFVPPVFDMLSKDSYFLQEEALLNTINSNIEKLEKSNDYLELRSKLYTAKEKAVLDIEEKKVANKKAKSIRKQKREAAKNRFSNQEFKKLEEELRNESIAAKQFINNVKRYWQHIINELEEKVSSLENPIKELKLLRKNKSAALQQYLFEQYQFLNSLQEKKNLLDLFPETNSVKMPAGSGECAAPKLLQYAFQNDLKPLAMAEFWWGQSPNKEIRKHLQFYPACQGKCKPILEHMLAGIAMDTNPMLQNPAIGKELELLFEDDDILVIHKPEAFLSVPGIHIQDSVATRIKNQINKLSGPIIVHRLDMDTSGLMVLAKHKKAHKKLQAQFINKTVRKRYTALLDGIELEPKGTINLPLRVDLDDRPRQLVCDEYGKKAITHWEVIEKNAHTTKVHFYPVTGRTHQLRVHASHSLGLNSPIIGDDLYGKKANRLHLHADTLTFLHPSSQEEMTFYKEAPF